MIKEDFFQRYREYMEAGGHSYDSWDLAAAWSFYQECPEKYSWLVGEHGE